MCQDFYRMIYYMHLYHTCRKNNTNVIEVIFVLCVCAWVLFLMQRDHDDAVTIITNDAWIRTRIFLCAWIATAKSRWRAILTIGTWILGTRCAWERQWCNRAGTQFIYVVRPLFRHRCFAQWKTRRRWFCDQQQIDFNNNTDLLYDLLLQYEYHWCIGNSSKAYMGKIGQECPMKRHN